MAARPGRAYPPPNRAVPTGAGRCVPPHRPGTVGRYSWATGKATATGPAGVLGTMVCGYLQEELDFLAKNRRPRAAFPSDATEAEQLAGSTGNVGNTDARTAASGTGVFSACLGNSKAFEKHHRARLLGVLRKHLPLDYRGDERGGAAAPGRAGKISRMVSPLRCGAADLAGRKGAGHGSFKRWASDQCGGRSTGTDFLRPTGPHPAVCGKQG